jgi:hypothetical protein
MDVEAEIRDLKRRMGELEGSFGFLTRQVGAVHTDLLEFEKKTEQNFKNVDQRFDQVDKRLDRLEQDVRGLRADMPEIVGDTMREVLREQRGKG